MKVSIDQERLAKLSAMSVDVGAHKSYKEGHCIMELAAWLRGLPITDRLNCVSVPVQTFLRHYNDGLSVIPRQALRGWAPKILGSAAPPKIECKRAFVAADYAVRVFAPFWLEHDGQIEAATKLRLLPKIGNNETAAFNAIAATEASTVADASNSASAPNSVAPAPVAAAHAAYAARAAYAANTTIVAAETVKLQPQVFKMLDEMLALS